MAQHGLRATPYLMVVDLIRQLCDTPETDSPEAVATKVHRRLAAVQLDPEAEAPYLLRLLGMPGETARLPFLSPEVLKTHTLAAMLRLCLSASRQRPVVIELEDLRWIDASSEKCLTALADRLSGAAILILGTYRPGYRPAWLDKSYATQLSLPRLTSSDGLHMVRGMLGPSRVSDVLVQQILAKASGNPFFLEELARSIAEHDDVDTPLAMPDTIQAVLTARIDRLPPDEKHVLQAAAVIGKEVSASLLRALTKLSEVELERILGHLQAAEFLYASPLFPDPVYLFKHVLTQEVAYQSLLQSTRQDYHRRVAQALQEQFPDTAE